MLAQRGVQGAVSWLDGRGELRILENEIFENAHPLWTFMIILPDTWIY